MQDLGKLGLLFVILAAAIITYQLACQPLVGLNDNGDFWRIMESYGLSYPATHQEDLLTWNRHYDWDGRLFRLKVFPSSELIPVGIAAALSGVVSKVGKFDVVVLGLVQGLLYVLGLGLVVWATKQWRAVPRVVLCLLLLVVFCDVGYVSYFNSLYTESASLIFFVAMMALLASGLLRDRSDKQVRGLLIAFFVASGLFVFAKVQNAPLGLLLALFGYRYAVTLQMQDKAAQAAATRTGKKLALALAAFSLLFWWGFRFVPGMQVNNVYNMVFNEITWHSSDPEGDLVKLGLDKSYMEYHKTFAWSPEVTEDLRRDVFRKVGDKGVVLFFVKHPARLWDLTKRCAKSAFVMRVPYLGNFEKHAVAHVKYDPTQMDFDIREYDNRGSGYPFRLPDAFRSQAFDTWSSLKEDRMPKSWWVLGLMMLINLAVIGVKSKWFDVSWRQRLVSQAHLCLVGCAALAFAVAVIGEAERDIVKHLFAFNLLCDACFIFTAAYMGALLMGSRKTYFSLRSK